MRIPAWWGSPSAFPWSSFAKKLLLFTAVLLMTGTAFAQAERDTASAFYHLDFVTKELDDNKLVNTRSYSMIVAADNLNSPNSIRTGSRMPVASGGTPSQFTYVDLGVNIDCRHVKAEAADLSLTIGADISTAAAGDTALAPALPPVIRQYKWNSTVLVPLRKPTLIYSSDDLGSKRKFQIELTATPIK